MNRTRSEALFAEALQLLPGGVNSPVRAFRAVGGTPFFAVSAQGAQVRDADGNQYIDYVGTWGPAIHGHAFAPIIRAIQETAARGTSFGIPNPLEIELAKRVRQFVPSVEKVRFTNSGTEACMTAIRLARGVTRRDLIVKFDGCYHGHGDSLLVKAGSGALTLGQPDSAGVPADLAKHTLVLPFNDSEALARAFTDQGERIAGVIVEPIPANAGLFPPRPGFHELLRELTTRHGALLIFDEVMTGFRLARGGAQELLGIRPDLSTFGKIIGGGLPVGAVGGRAELMDHLAPLGPVYQAGTLSGNPLAMAAGIAALDALADGAAYARLERLGATLENGFKEAAHQTRAAVRFQRLGSMFCAYFTSQPVWNLTDALTSDRARFGRFFHAMLDRGVYLAPSQFEAGFISTAHSEADLETTTQAVVESLRASAA
ncbi:MAG: glutamate-1-semialdehyde 2,1-aminomutase [Verrucomicrobiales bacterium]|nr:glutamate-1-semialdehyde 2,1-aminomutase [Verrucomicrobiales bacterium]